jgi:aminopeptidase N
MKPNHIDQATYANFDKIATTHLDLKFEVDFNLKQFKGSVLHQLECLESTDRVIMDYVGIDIQKVSLANYNGELDFFLHTDLNKNLGNAVEIVLPEACVVGKNV